MTGALEGPPTSLPAAAQAIVDALAYPAAILDAGLDVFLGNEGFTRLFAPDANDVWRRLLKERVGHRELREALADPASGALGLEVESELPLSGRRRLVVRAMPLRSVHPGPGGTLVTVSDFTARELGGGSGRRAAATGRSRALAAATHDLRQPLQAMTLLGSLLARRVGDPDVLPLIGRLEDTIRAMSGMLNTLLDINRWDTEHGRPDTSNFVLAELLERVHGEFAERMRQRGLRWTVVPCHVAVHSDQHLLAQMLRSLAHYAMENSHEGRMLLGARRNGHRLRIELWDSGFETAAADARVVHDAMRPPNGRMPLLNPTLAPGLSMVRRIADLLGHRIDVGFKPGRGSVFSVEVPIAPPSRAAAMPSRPASPERVTRGIVFVIDDDASVREIMRDLLEATGWATEVFASSEEFIMADRPGRTGCILVDAVLPGMSGVELLRLLKDRRHRLPAIMLTGAGDVRMAVEAMAAGALNFIEKPVRYEELLPSIERAFDLLADSSKLETWRESALTRAASLTARQRQILELVLAGQPSRNIAADLGVSRRTVENHRAIIMKKMGAASIPQLIRVGIAAF